MAVMPMRQQFFDYAGRRDPAYDFPSSQGARASYSSGASHHQGWPADYHGDNYSMATMELMVPMCCTKCEGDVRAVLLAMEGVRHVVTDPHAQRVIVTGYAVDPMRALRQVQHVNDNAALWRDPSSSTRNDMYGDDMILYHRRYSQSGGSNRSPRDQSSKQLTLSRAAALDSGISSNNVCYSTSHCPGHAGSTSTTHFVIPASDHVERVEFH